MPIIHGKAPFSPGQAFFYARYACAGDAFAVEARTPARAAAPSPQRHAGCGQALHVEGAHSCLRRHPGVTGLSYAACR